MPPPVVRASPAVALIAHSCRACSGDIDMGEQHLRVFVLRDGQGQRFSVCASCARGSGRGHLLTGTG